MDEKSELARHIEDAVNMAIVGLPDAQDLCDGGSTGCGYARHIRNAVFYEVAGRVANAIANRMTEAVQEIRETPVRGNDEFTKRLSEREYAAGCVGTLNAWSTELREIAAAIRGVAGKTN